MHGWNVDVFFNHTILLPPVLKITARRWRQVNPATLSRLACQLVPCTRTPTPSIVKPHLLPGTYAQPDKPTRQKQQAMELPTYQDPNTIQRQAVPSYDMYALPEKIPKQCSGPAPTLYTEVDRTNHVSTLLVCVPLSVCMCMCYYLMCTML